MKKFFLIASMLVVTAVHAEPLTYDIEPTHTSVVVEVRHFGTSTIRMRIPSKSGTVTIDPAAGTGKVGVLFDPASVASGVPGLDENLKGAKYFNVATYPEASFTASDFKFDGDKVVAVNGFLSLIGNSKPVSLTVVDYNCYTSPFFKKQVCGGDFVTTIKRSEWNINVGIPFMSDDVKLQVQIEAIKQ